MKNLSNIYSEYYNILEKYFLPCYKEAKVNCLSSHQFASKLNRDTKLYKNILRDISTISDSIENFWEANYKDVMMLYNNLPGLKSRFGGDIGPQDFDHIIERVAIYFDTIVIPDPMLRIVNMPLEENKKCFYLIKYAINQLNYKEVFLTELFPPIALLIPDMELVGEAKFNFVELNQYGVIDSIIIINELYNTKLNSAEESLEFLSKFKSLDEAYKEIINPAIIWWDEYYPKDILAQLESVKRRGFEGLSNVELPYGLSDPRFLFLQLNGRLMQINDVLVRSNEINASPLISAPVSFHWLKNKIQANQKIFLQEDYKKINLGVTNSLLSEDKEWLSNLSIENIIQIRLSGTLSNFRKEITSDINLLGELSLNEIEKVSAQVDYNLNSIFLKHQSTLKQIEKDLIQELKWKGSSFLGSIAMAFLPLVGNILPTWSSYAGGIVGFSNLSDIISEVRKYLNENRKQKQSPVGILFTAKNDFR